MITALCDNRNPDNFTSGIYFTLNSSRRFPVRDRVPGRSKVSLAVIHKLRFITLDRELHSSLHAQCGDGRCGRVVG